MPSRSAVVPRLVGGWRTALWHEGVRWRGSDCTRISGPDLSCHDDGVAWAAFPEEGLWCPIGPDGQRQALPDCEATDFGFENMDSEVPPRLNDDRFISSFLWMRAILAYCVDDPVEPPFLALGKDLYKHPAVPSGCRG